MINSRLLRYALSFCGACAGAVAVNLLLPVIMNSRLLFGGLVASLLIGGVVLAAIAVREMGRR